MSSDQITLFAADSDCWTDLSPWTNCPDLQHLYFRKASEGWLQVWSLFCFVLVIPCFFQKGRSSWQIRISRWPYDRFPLLKIRTEKFPKVVDSDHTCCVDTASYEAEKCKSWKCWGLIEFGGVDRVVDRRRQVEEWPEAAETKFNHCPKRKWCLWMKHGRQQVPYTINWLLAYSPDIVSPLSNL